ncbi:ABC transporter [Cercophora newfieldiana]|uniref:ABC transporter n=1 Tax=Cercophora newfieldiana TaxID=92897 RepID=A0AA39YPR4_9PEZI|nr:ABC transporter [Cercophora newfieldiana]
MTTAASSGDCPLFADDQFGPRVDIACRSFDFTLLFEDAFFVALLAALFLLLMPLRLPSLYNTPVMSTTYRLASWKLALITLLFASHLLFLTSRLSAAALHTRLSLPSSILSTLATLTAAFHSFLSDQRSLAPSDTLVLYFSASTLLSIPRLRTLYLLPSFTLPKAAWTLVFISTTLLVIAESLKKTRFLRPAYQSIATPETVTSFWSRSFFTWVLPFFQEGYGKVLKLGDIPRVDTALEEEKTHGGLEREWKKRGPKGRWWRLIRAAFRANVWGFLGAIPPRLMLGGLGFIQPFLIESAVREVQLQAGERRWGEEGKALVGGFILVYVGIAVSRALYWRQTYRMIARIRSGLIASIYRHTTSLQATAVKDSAAITLMGTDVERIVQSIRLLHELWACIPEAAVGIWLLARQLGVASVVPMVICMVSLAAVSPVAAKFGPAQRAWVERVEKRVAVTASMLGDMKGVKMLGLSGALSTIITQLRVLEMKTSERVRGLFVWQIVIGNTPTTLAQFVTFAVYAIISVAKKDEGLLGPQAFASISLINLVTFPVMIFCQALPACVQAVACFGRVEEYLLKEPGTTESTSSSTSGGADDEVQLQQVQVQASSQDPKTSLMAFEDASISWSSDSDPVLKDLTLTIRPGLTAIVGPVASGKSTLLASLIGETRLTNGSVAPSSLSGVAFCPQTPWIMDDTIRQNITGGLEVDQKWYDFSVEASGLQGDISRMVRGDETRCGSNGAGLSGGQRQRVALARAIYSRLPVVVLDDVMSGLDAKTASLVTTKLFGVEGYFRRAGVSVIIATHSRRILPYMDFIVVLDSGRVTDTGSYEEILQRSAHLVEQAEASIEVGDASSEAEGDVDGQSNSKPAEGASETEPLIQEASLTRRSGSWSVYKYYFRSAGLLTAVLWIFWTFVGAVFAAMMPIWVGRWTFANEKAPNQQLGFYLGVYAVFVVLANLGTFMELRTFCIRVINNTALKLHADLLDATLRAPFSFFQKTDTGTVTNRFSQDMDLIDMTLPMQAIQFTTAAASCLVQLIIICVLGKYLAAAIPVLATTLFVVQRYYLRTSRQVRLIDIEAKAPLYKHFIETAQGVATIRAFRWSDGFHKRHAEMLNYSQRPFYMLLCIQQWLSLVLDLIVGALAVVLVAVATSTAGGLSPAALGVALVLILDFNMLLTQAIQAWTKLETSIGAVARVRQFVDDTPSEPLALAAPPASWPSSGAINFHKISASYSPSSPPTLNSLSLSIPAGCKLAIVGPSGSGKTSLIMSLLRLLPINSGHITLDDVDISSLDADTLRSSLNVIPQDAYFMPGTVRFNIDPRAKATDEEIERALGKVGLWERVCSVGGLDGELDTAEWSQGERQLLSLARAVLVKGKVLILDEAGSSVDAQMEAVMQDVIEKEFEDATVISVLHRFTFIERFDRVAVLKQGVLVECDAPRVLLERDSVFAELYRTHHQRQ